jgi:hypothetical protein
MKTLNMNTVSEYIDDHILYFYERQLALLQDLTLEQLLEEGNPYLLTIGHSKTAGQLVLGLLERHLSFSAEKHFGDFLERLAIFVAGETCGGHKSTAQGVDLEFIDDDVHYVVSIKSGTSWGNSSQVAKLVEDMKRAKIRVQQSRTASKVQPVLGICYGKTRTNFNYRFPDFWKVVGQNFWYLISENEKLYTDIVEPIGYRAKQHNKAFEADLDSIVNRFTGSFIERFCAPSGAIDWERLVAFNSGNFDLEGAVP